MNDGSLYIFHEDDFDGDVFKNLKVGDEINNKNYWYKMNRKTLSKVLKSIKPKKKKNYNKAMVFLDNPIKVQHKTNSFGGIPDGSVVKAYLIASKGGQHLIYCAKDCFFDGEIDSGTGSVNICVKRGNYYYGKYKNDNIMRGWRNVGEESIAEFLNRFLDGLLGDYYEEEDLVSKYTDTQLNKVFKKIDAIELAEAKKQLAKHKKEE